MNEAEPRGSWQHLDFWLVPPKVHKDLLREACHRDLAMLVMEEGVWFWLCRVWGE